jgi:hypothetical protein
LDEGSEDSRTTLVSTFSTWVGLTANVAGRVDDFPPRRDEMGGLAVGWLIGITGGFEGLVGDWGPTTPSFSSAGLSSSACRGSILTSYLLLSTVLNLGLGRAGKEMLLLIDLRRFLVRSR